MKQIAIIRHMYIFDAVSTWQSGSAFEKDLADFFAAHGYEASLVEPKGNVGDRVMYIEKIELMPTLINKPAQVGRPPGLPTLFNRLAPHKENAATRDFKRGTFLPRKGYLKKPSVT